MMSKETIREKLHQQIDNLPDEIVEKIAGFTSTMSQFHSKNTTIEHSLEDSKKSSNEHNAFGMWADHPEAIDPATYAVKLRQQIELREDAATYTPD